MENDIEFIIICEQAKNFLSYQPLKHPVDSSEDFEMSGCVESHSVKNFENIMLSKFKSNIYPNFVKIFDNHQQAVNDNSSSIALVLQPNEDLEEECTLPTPVDAGILTLNLKLLDDKLIATDGGLCPEYSQCSN